MKNVNSFRRGVFGLALAGIAGVAFMATSSNAMTVALHERNGDEVTVDRSVDAFSKIRVKGGFELVLTAGKDHSVKLEGYERDVQRTETYTRGDTLVLDNTDDHDDDDFNFDGDGVKVIITMPSLEEFEVLGAVDAELKGIESETLVLELKGAGAIEMQGTCGSLDVELKGAGEVDAEDLKCKNVEVDVKGVGEARVYASESVDANVSGIGSITVYGEPKKVRQSDSLLSKIRIK